MIATSCSRQLLEETTLATPRELSSFLESVERRAFKQAMFAVREEEAALDIVQDSMLKLAEKYGDRPDEEFPMLFQRILQNTIRDYYRRSKVRSMWTTLLSAFSSDDDDDHDPLETLAADEDDAGPRTPESKLLQAQTLNAIDDEIKKLPARQREAFLMRYWEDMDVAETAAAMGCSEGSVKTHCSRATHALAAALSAKGIKL
ncbi:MULTISPECIES: RNA polymerase sigma factor [Dechloromonas]|uniref:RNA polymerase sigma factor n=1 Tax=Dechloromonas TaxID=73029 RepID=UPI00299D5FF6|nr:RNA polymerase sigma factor [Dechloromonas denitrificans]